jgi:hypothetical protein
MNKKKPFVRNEFDFILVVIVLFMYFHQNGVNIMIYVQSIVNCIVYSNELLRGQLGV